MSRTVRVSGSGPGVCSGVPTVKVMVIASVTVMVVVAAARIVTELWSVM